MNKIKYLLFCTLLTIGLFGFNISNVNAATGSFSISSVSSATVGNTFSVTVKATGSKMFYWQYFVSYDASKLKLISGNTTIQGEADDAINGTNSVSATFSFKALTASTTSISVSRGDANMNIDTSFNSISFTKVSKSITATTPAPKSSNNNLATLSVDNATLSPVFSANTTSYTVEFEPNTTEINIGASVADSTATITGTGKIPVIEGQNTLNIVVTAANGTTKTYTIIATVKEFNPVSIKINGETYTAIRKTGLYDPPINFTATTVKIGSEDVLAYTNKYIGNVIGVKDSKDKIKLYLYDSKTKTYSPFVAITIDNINLYLKTLKTSDIPFGYDRTILKLDNNSITSYNYKNNVKYYLIYGVDTLNGKESLYSYDKVNKSIQLFYNNQVNDMKNTVHTYLIVIIALGALLLSLVGICIYELKSNKKPKDKKISDKVLKKFEKLDDTKEIREKETN